jgi:hypothetical protein
MHAVMARAGVELQFHLFLTWTLDGVVSFTPRLLYTRGKNPYPFNRRLGGPQSRSERSAEGQNLLFLTAIETWFLGRTARSLVTIMTELPRFLTLW